MVGSYFKCSDSLAKLISSSTVLGLVFTLSGCATFDGNHEGNGSDAAQNIGNQAGPVFAKKAQETWESRPYVATADYHFALAEAYSSEGKVEHAIEEFKAALIYDENASVLHAKLAAEYLKKGAMSAAIEECKKAIALDTHYLDARLMLGGIYSINNETENALIEYDAILKQDPKNDEAAIFKTQVLVEKGRQDEALKFIRTFTSKVSDSAAAWFYAGKLEQNKDRTNEAIKDYRKSLDIRPGFTQATLALGLIFETHGETVKALELYQDQLDQKQDVQIAGRLATLYLKLNQTEYALKTLNVMAVLDPDDMNTQLKIGLVHLQRQEWEPARKVLEAILEKVPDSDKVHYYLSAVLEQQGDLNHSVEHLQKVSTDSKLFEDANLHVAMIYRKLAQKQKAFDSMQTAIQKSPENRGFYMMLASLYEDDKNLKDAALALGSGLKIFPDDEKMLYFHGAILDKLGKQDEAVAEMETLLKKNPNHADAMNYVAYTWTAQGVHLKDAEDLLKRALKLKPDSPFILDSLGWNQFMLGNNQNAMIYLEKAASLKSDEREILEHLVEVYSRNHMPERAESTRARIKKLQTALSEAAQPQETAVSSDRNPASVDQK